MLLFSKWRAMREAANAQIMALRAQGELQNRPIVHIVRENLLLLKAALWYLAFMIEAFIYFPIVNLGTLLTPVTSLIRIIFFKTRKFVQRFFFLIGKGNIYLRGAIKYTVEFEVSKGNT